MSDKWDSPKEYLSQLVIIDYKIDCKIEQMNELWSKVTSVNRIMKEDLIKKSGNSDVMGNVDRIIDIQREADNLIDEYINKKDKIEKEIINLNDDVFMTILLKRYINKKTLADIAEEMNYSYSHVRKLHGLSLDYFKLQYSHKFGA